MLHSVLINLAHVELFYILFCLWTVSAKSCRH